MMMMTAATETRAGTKLPASMGKVGESLGPRECARAE